MGADRGSLFIDYKRVISGALELRRSIVVGFLTAIIGAIFFLGSLAVALSSLRGPSPASLAVLAFGLGVVIVLSLLPIYLTYKGFKHLCEGYGGPGSFVCLMKNVFLLVLLLAVAVLVTVIPWMAATGAGRGAELSPALSLAGKIAEIVALAIWAGYYTALRSLGEDFLVTRIVDGTTVGYVAVFLDFIDTFANTSWLFLVSSILTIVAIIFIYVGLGDLVGKLRRKTFEESEEA